MYLNKRTARQKRVDLIDLIARRVISFSGVITILCVLAIVFFIVMEVGPLFSSPKISKNSSWNAGSRVSTGKPVFLGLGEYREIAYRLADAGRLDFFNLRPGSEHEFHINSKEFAGFEESRIISAHKKANGSLVVFSTNDGKAGWFEVDFSSDFSSGTREVKFKTSVSEPIEIDEDGKPLTLVAGTKNEDGLITIAVYSESGISIVTYDQEMEELAVNTVENTEKISATAIDISKSGEMLVLGNAEGRLFVYSIEEGEAEETENINIAGKKITALSFLIGDEALLIGDESGEISEWFQVRHILAKNKSGSSATLKGYGKINAGEEKLVIDKDYIGNKDIDPAFEFSSGGMKYLKIRSFKGGDSPVTEIAPSPRDKGFVTSTANGEAAYHYSTTAKTFNRFKTDSPLSFLLIAPKGDGFAGIGANGFIYDYEMDIGHPDVTFSTLFSGVWYEGYGQPDTVWQSTGGSDEFEPKFSLWPLIFGTVKGAFFAMLFSGPIAILAALYVSQMAPKNMRAVIKPSIELMAAMPSVVVGFLAGLWLAPVLDKNLMEGFLLILSIPSGWLVLVAVFSSIPFEKRPVAGGSMEIFWLFMVTAVSGVAAILFAGPIEAVFFGGDIKSWLHEMLGILYDPRNSLVVGFALGFAVIPIIFTISEDAMSSVPKVLSSAAYALAANRWQTAIHIILPAASPGIFAAVMLGLGRAVGETMIVLMATGNTPIIDWSLFNGFRAMSAAIAVEIPEAPDGGSLYRILFLAGLILFFFTFSINTFASLISANLRKKYSRF